ncbi:MAG: ATP-binding cassette domain-containing protein [Halanaerobiaceae bacterium]
MLEVKNLEKSYNDFRVLKEINFRIERGEIFGFLGRNGAGKTTTINILTGLIGYDHGQVLVNGEELGQQKKWLQKSMGYLPENPVFYDYMTGKEYLQFTGKINNYEQKELEKRCDELLEQVKLKEACNRRIGGYSRGMKQRLALAVALFNRPEILFLDEPTSALDPEGRREMIDLIKRSGEMNTTVFLSTHILSDIEKVCTKVSILNEGRIVLSKNIRDLKEEYILPIYDIIFEQKPDHFSELENKNWVDKVKIKGNEMSVYLKTIEKGKTELLRYLGEKDAAVESFQIRKNTLEDIFIRVVNNDE